MKVKFSAESKKVITLEVAPIAKEICRDFNTPDEDINWYAQVAARIASGLNGDFEILKAEAEISRNSNVFNLFSDASDHLDIWFTFYAYDRFYGFYEIGCYISDLWQSNGENADELRSRMYVHKFTK